MQPQQLQQWSLSYWFFGHAALLPIRMRRLETGQMEWGYMGRGNDEEMEDRDGRKRHKETMGVRLGEYGILEVARDAEARLV